MIWEMLRCQIDTNHLTFEITLKYIEGSYSPSTISFSIETILSPDELKISNSSFSLPMGNDYKCQYKYVQN